MDSSKQRVAACSAEMKPTSGQERGEIVSGQLGVSPDKFLTEAASQGFSGAVLVAKNQEIMLQKGYGLANRATGTPNTAHTVFNICFMSKVFTSAAQSRRSPRRGLGP
jgi:CubicO group peptidase (beta-lactamase class C family)